MIAKLVTALLLVLVVLYVGDPYSSDYTALAPFLPPAPEDSELLAMRDSVAQATDSIDIEQTVEDIANHDLTQGLIQTLKNLRSYVLEALISLKSDADMLAQAEQ